MTRLLGLLLLLPFAAHATGGHHPWPLPPVGKPPAIGKPPILTPPPAPPVATPAPPIVTPPAPTPNAPPIAQPGPPQSVPGAVSNSTQSPQSASRAGGKTSWLAKGGWAFIGVAIYFAAVIVSHERYCEAHPGRCYRPLRDGMPD